MLLAIALATLGRAPLPSRGFTLPCIGVAASSSRELLVVGTAQRRRRSHAPEHGAAADADDERAAAVRCGEEAHLGRRVLRSGSG